MNKKAFTLVEIMIAAGIVALLSSIAIPNVLRARVASNETFARATLKSLSTASETYMLILGSYPGNITSLTSASPPYINQSFCGSTLLGYQYVCTFSAASYLVVASPVVFGKTGTTTYTIATGGVSSP